jgi:hypothetical protein
MSADGTGQTNLTNNPAADAMSDWQPVLTGYPRPKGAGPLRVPLVPAYTSCPSPLRPPNSTHGAPLSYSSCTAPLQASSFLTVGTPDANGAGAKALGSVLLRVKGDASDVLIDVSTTDVRCQMPAFNTTCGDPNNAAGFDYTGELWTVIALRITDRLNTPYPGGPGPGTVRDTRFPAPFPVRCTPTADTTVGSTCAVSTSANAVLPGSVQAGKRAIWQLDQVQVFDGGQGGVAGSGDATLFEDQGVFVP